MPITATTTEPLDTPTSPEMASSSPVQAKKQPTRSIYTECVRYLREVWGINIKGNANTIVANRPMSDVTLGDVIIFKYPSGVHHVALIIGYSDAGGWLVVETNYEPGKETRRNVPTFDPAILGFYHPE
jgi:hypothetical protein